MQAVILAGGRGERLRPLTDSVPKPMLPVGGKPVLWHQIKLLERHGIRDVIICGNYIFNAIKNYFYDGSAFGVKINYVEEHEPMGTGGALKLAESRINGDFLLLMGDVMTNLDLTALTRFHKRNACMATMVLRETDHPKDSDIVQIDDHGRIVRFFFKNDKNKVGNLGNTGIFAFRKAFLDRVSPKPCNLERDVIAPLVGKEAIYGFVTSDYVRDMGTFERYERVKADMKSGRLFA